MLPAPSVETGPRVFVAVVVVVVVDVEVDVLGVVAGVVVGVGWVVDGCVVVAAGASVVVGSTTTVFPALPAVLSRL
jgi:hypothetical protein